MIQDHPRVCGNYHPTKRRGVLELGSPPRVRELRALFIIVFHTTRITPACAGITLLQSLNFCNSWDHPRVCGNYFDQETELWTGVGSPPRVRELRRGNAQGWQRRRITPACAGITSSVPGVKSTSGDHPRVCGNYLELGGVSPAAWGSPPRVRELPI